MTVVGRSPAGSLVGHDERGAGARTRVRGEVFDRDGERERGVDVVLGEVDGGDGDDGALRDGRGAGEGAEREPKQCMSHQNLPCTVAPAKRSPNDGDSESTRALRYAARSRR